MRLTTAAAIGVAFAGYVLGFDYYDRTTNFQPVDARVSAISDQCYLEKVEHGALTKTTSTSDLLRCDVAEGLTRNHPHWRGYAIMHKIEVQLAYVSPADGASHTSSLRLSPYRQGPPLHAGDVVKVLASKTVADKTREI
jgi:hypothetical protein